MNASDDVNFKTNTDLSMTPELVLLGLKRKIDDYRLDFYFSVGFV